MKRLFDKLKKVLTLYLIVSMVMFGSLPVAAEEVSPTPEPTVATATETTPEPTTVQEETTPTPTPDEAAQREARREAARLEWEAAYYQSLTPTPSPPAPTTSDAPGTADATINSGANESTGGSTSGGSDSADTATFSNQEDTASLAVVGGVVSNRPSATVGTTGNGALSDNSAVVSNDASATTAQGNSAQVSSDTTQSATTGESEASFNVGDTNLKTGDANTSGTAMTAVNTNVDGVMVSEFNIVDDHKGDIVLSPEAFAANCIVGCGGGSTEASGNGAGSTNTSTTDTTTSDTTTQNNNGTVGNNLDLSSNSGDNVASFNSGGDTAVETGDANVSANALTFANNNLSGNVYYGVVNIYGDLEGDIILPDFSEADASTVATTIDGNGAESTNTSQTAGIKNSTTAQNNDVTINNNLILDANTGGNEADLNTGGNNTTQTGNTSVDANIFTISNMNIVGGTWWLVFVNEAGNWIGRLIGYPDGTNMAASQGVEFRVGADGQVTASDVSGNGAQSTNTTTNNSNIDNTTTQNNNAVIENNLNLSANTGRNEANYNTGGNNTIRTGDAKIIANIINFVNNNIVGNGKLVVTVVNVFGNWLGNFVTPGQQKETAQTSTPTPTLAPTVSEQPAQNTAPVGGVTETSNNQSTEVNTTQTDGTSQTTVMSAAFHGATRSLLARNTYQSKADASNISDKQVAGLSMVNDQASTFDDSRKRLRLNLAWLLLLIPAGLMILGGRKLLEGRAIGT